MSTSTPAAVADRPEDEHTPNEHTPDEHTPTEELPRRLRPTPAEARGEVTEPTSSTTSKETDTSTRDDATAALHQAGTDGRTEQSTPASEIAKKTAADENGRRATIRVVAVYGTP